MYIDISGCVCPKKLSKFIIKRKGFCLYSEYKIQGLKNKRNFHCASYCLQIIFVTKMIRTDFESAVLTMYYPRFS